MNRFQHYRSEMFDAVIVFASEHAELFPIGSVTYERLNEIRTFHATLKEEFVTQVQNARAGIAATKIKQKTRRSLHAHLRRIAKTAAFIGRTAEGFATSFQLPESEANTAIVEAARKFAAAAVPVRERFLAHGLPPAFIDDLRRDIATIEGKTGEHGKSREEHQAATRNIESMLKQCNDALLALDLVMSNKLQDDPATLKSWKIVRRVQPRRKKHAARTARLQSGETAQALRC